MFRSAGVIRFVKHIELAKGGDMCLINALLIIIIIIIAMIDFHTCK